MTNSIKTNYNEEAADLFVKWAGGLMTGDPQIYDAPRGQKRIEFETKNGRCNVYLRSCVPQDYDSRNKCVRDWEADPDLFLFKSIKGEQQYLQQNFWREDCRNLIALVCIRPDKSVAAAAVFPLDDYFCRNCTSGPHLGLFFNVRLEITRKRLKCSAPWYEGEYRFYVPMNGLEYFTRGYMPLRVVNGKKSFDEHAADTLKKFLELPHNSDSVLDCFRYNQGARLFTPTDNPKERFVYVPATRKNSVLLVAHADVFDMSEKNVQKGRCVPCGKPNTLRMEKGVIYNADPERLLGADDRAGCAICDILYKELGHGVLILDGEEDHQLGAFALTERCPELSAEIQEKYAFFVEFDRSGDCEYKCYNVGTDRFRRYVEEKTGFYEPEVGKGRSDISALATKICGVNLPVGYYDEHYLNSKVRLCTRQTLGERLVLREWLNSLHISMNWLRATDIPRFELS